MPDPFMCLNTQGDGSCWTDGGSPAHVPGGDGRRFCTVECHDDYVTRTDSDPCEQDARYHLPGERQRCIRALAAYLDPMSV